MTAPAWLAGIAFLLAACNKNEDDHTSGNEEMTELNVAYGSDAAQKMDLYLPEGRSQDSTRVLVMIHGGAWVDGDKADFNQYVTLLRQQFPDYAIFNINYRLAANGNNLFPAQENDVEAAVNFINDRRADYQVSSNFVYLGASAGAQLAMLQGYKHVSVVKPTAVVDLFGPTEMKTLYSSSPFATILLGQLLGGSPDNNATAYDQSSPIFFADETSAPTLILQGGMDDVVPPSQSEKLRDKLTTVGVANDYIFYPAEGHGWTGSVLNDTLLKIAAFLRAHP